MCARSNPQMHAHAGNEEDKNMYVALTSTYVILVQNLDGIGSQTYVSSG